MSAPSRIELFGPEDLDSPPPHLVPPDPAWREAADRIAGRLQASLGPRATRIDHIGSTAVPGTWSKATVDIQVSVPDVDDEGAYREAIVAAGWPLRLREPGHRLFRPLPPAPRAVHIHVCGSGSPWERDHLLFRDYLRAHPAAARAYEAVKRELAARPGIRRTEYTEAKTPFIRATLEDANRWAEETGWTVSRVTPWPEPRNPSPMRGG